MARKITEDDMAALHRYFQQFARGRVTRSRVKISGVRIHLQDDRLILKAPSRLVDSARSAMNGIGYELSSQYIGLTRWRGWPCYEITRPTY